MNIAILYGGSQDGRFFYFEKLPPRVLVPVVRKGTMIRSKGQEEETVYYIEIETYINDGDFRYLYTETESNKP